VGTIGLVGVVGVVGAVGVVGVVGVVGADGVGTALAHEASIRLSRTLITINVTVLSFVCAMPLMLLSPFTNKHFENLPSSIGIHLLVSG
jgi:hypothetical protein